MDKRTLLAIFLILGVLLIDSVWWSARTRQKHAPAPAATATGQATPGTGSGSGAPAGGTSPAAPSNGTPASGSAAATAPVPVAGAPTIGGETLVATRVPDAPIEERSLKGDGFEATFSTLGGSISSWVVPAFTNPMTKAPVDLVRPGTRALEVVVSTGDATFDFSSVPFRIADFSETRGSVTFVAEDSSGVSVTKIYTLDRDKKLLDLELRFSAPAGLGPIRYRMGWGSPLPITELYGKPVELHGTALLGEKLVSLDARGLGKEGLKVEKGNVRWVGNRSKYFVAAIVPDSLTVDEVAFLPAADNSASAWITGAAAPGSLVVRHARLYAGPLHFDTLLGIGSGLEQAVNLGWRWLHPVSTFLLKCLLLLHQWIPNYGIGIILLSLATKVVFYPLTQSSLRTMKVMHRLQPRMNELREKHKDDPVKMNSAVMALYKEHKVNPLGGCLPMLLQVPVFLALYNVLLYSVQLRAAGFVGHVHDLSAPDLLMQIGPLPIHLLPILMTLSTFWMQALTPTDPNQKPLMMLMPVMMLFFMYNLPSGVILYWTVNNVFSALQQQWVNIADDREMAAAGAK
ncbi:MAG TPA: membrane protein insertase YidC [Candidatus Eisenbacteria bacterium]|nr:membrane protein insertase YidC [Candidatus Eisenbacteria bacterium]